MKKISIDNLSIIGLLLMTVSALTAAIVPSKKAASQANSANNGTLRQYSAEEPANLRYILSCVHIPGAGLLNCHETIASGSTVTPYPTFFITIRGHIYQTIGNTSNSILNNGIDTTSVLVQVN